mgnify:CR=1 FL=1
MKAAAIQTVSTPRVEENLATAAALLEQAARAGAELAVLPEYFCLFGHSDADKLLIAEPFGQGPLQEWLADQARRLGLWLAGGTIPLRAQDADKGADKNARARAFNTLLVFSPEGRCAARYDKMHLFRFNGRQRAYDESLTLQAGAAPALFDLPSRDGHTWRVGLSVCYDLRFAELYRHYAAQGADLLLAPSAFTWETGQAHWQTLLRARAIENLACVIAPGQGGTHENGRRTWGHSMLINAWGQVLAMQAEGAGVALADLDAAHTAACRASLPALTHRVL